LKTKEHKMQNVKLQDIIHVQYIIYYIWWNFSRNFIGVGAESGNKLVFTFSWKNKNKKAEI